MKIKILSLLLAACLLCGSLTVNAAASFTDIPDPDPALAAGVLQSMGIVGGVGDGRYSPDTVLTRAQFCVFMIHTLAFILFHMFFYGVLKKTFLTFFFQLFNLFIFFFYFEEIVYLSIIFF